MEYGDPLYASPGLFLQSSLMTTAAAPAERHQVAAAPTQQNQTHRRASMLSSSYDDDSGDDEKDDEIRRLRAQLKEANERTRQLQQQVESTHKDDDEEEEDKLKPNPSHYAAKADPIVLENGFIDGRSNAHAAFMQKVDLLKEFQKEFGHVNVPSTLEKGHKYYKLPNFLMKQRKYYRSYQKNAAGTTRITPERIEILEQVEGFDWGKMSPEEGWKDMYSKAKSCREKYGHTCLSIEESVNDEKLVKWIATQRAIFRAYRARHVLKNDESEEQQSPSEENNGPRKKKRKTRVYIPEYWTRDMYDQLAALKCPWLESFDEDPRARSFPKQRHPLYSNLWFQLLKEFRAHVAKHGNGIVIVGKKTASTSLPRWVLDQRRHYDGVQSGEIPTCDFYQAGFELLKSAGFVFDKQTLQEEEKRLLHLKIEEQKKANFLASSAGKVKVAKEKEQEALVQLSNAEKKLKEAQNEVKNAKAAVTLAKKATKKAELEEKADPVGKLVRVKPRGEGVPHGVAKVLSFYKISVVGSELSIYDVEFIDSGEKASHVDGAFVTKVDEGDYKVAALMTGASAVL